MDGQSGLIVAQGVSADTTDHLQLLPMLEQTWEVVGRTAVDTVADRGYRSDRNVGEVEARGDSVLVELFEREGERSMRSGGAPEGAGVEGEAEAAPDDRGAGFRADETQWGISALDDVGAGGGAAAMGAAVCGAQSEEAVAAVASGGVAVGDRLRGKAATGVYPGGLEAGRAAGWD